MNRSPGERRDDAAPKPQQQGEQQPKPGQQGQQQQEAGGGAGNQYGEGNYQATRDYNRGLKEHMEKHDIEREARDTAPRSEEEARQMEEAERAGKDKARGGGSGN
jgi:hypothetical protein